MTDYTPETALRVTAKELNETTVELDLGGGERDTTYHLLPSGDKVSRVLLYGVITGPDDIRENDQYDMYNAAVLDPLTGERVHFTAGQYAPEVKATLTNFRDEGQYPYAVMLKAKARTFPDDDTGEPIAALNPEDIAEVQQDPNETLWNYEVLMQTFERFDTPEGEKVENGIDFVERAKQEYPDAREDLKSAMLEAAEKFADSGN